QCTGPCGIYIGLGAALVPTGANKVLLDATAPKGVTRLPIAIATDLPVFLGSCERGPRVVFEPHYRPIPLNEFGDSPYDMMYCSESAWIFAELTRWNERVLGAV